MVNRYFEELKLYGNRANNESGDNHKKWYYIAPAISVGVVLLVIVVVATKRYLRKQRQNEGSALYAVSSPDNQCSIEYIYRPVYRNQKNPIYLVPYSALPEDFDFSRPDVIVRGDYIILKDLNILQQPVIRPPSTPTTPTAPNTYFEEFKTQPYNPNFYI